VPQGPKRGGSLVDGSGVHRASCADLTFLRD
jgi:hypothetical protein